jgi:uncharacterized OB-fold protein
MDDKQFLYQQQKKKEYEYKQQVVKETTAKCHHCGASVPLDAEICPECKYPVRNDHCTFCGAKIFPEDKFCPECGNPINGIQCPKCGAINFRGFCYNCHEPLTIHAKNERQKALADPKFQKAVALAKELEKLSDTIVYAKKNTKVKLQSLSKEDRELVESYRDLLENLSGLDYTSDVPQASQEDEDTPQIDLADTMSKFKQKIADLETILKEFEPNKNDPPQLQRDFCSARNVKIKTSGTELVKVGWVCNYCGYTHHYPEECSKPQCGGTWKYKEIDIDKIEWVKE